MCWVSALNARKIAFLIQFYEFYNILQGNQIWRQKKETKAEG